MSLKELDRAMVIRQVIDKKIRQCEAAYRLELSLRQIKRLCKKYKNNGPQGLIHGLRGKSSAKAFDKEKKEFILTLWRTQLFADFGPTLFSEKLSEMHDISISDETLRNWIPPDNPKPLWRRKKRPHRRLRERKAHVGELLQGDGSHHDWFEGRGGKCNLQTFVDDATNRVYARFYPYEGTIPVMDLSIRYCLAHGAPHAVYLDMHSTYKSQKRLSKEQRIAGEEALSQYGRALKDLSIILIHAHSPQAKGRVENIFGTFQDRLVKELRLRNISTIDEANLFLDEYLPVYNARFAKAPRETGDWHKKFLTPKQIRQAFCIKHTRVVQKDSTISYLNKRFLILDPVCRTTITVEEYVTGSLIVRAPTGKELRYKRIPLELYERNKTTKITQETQKQEKKAKTPYKPKPNHPWRKETSRYIDLKRAQQRASTTKNVTINTV